MTARNWQRGMQRSERSLPTAQPDPSATLLAAIQQLVADAQTLEDMGFGTAATKSVSQIATEAAALIEVPSGLTEVQVRSVVSLRI